MDANSIQFQALITFLVPFVLQLGKASRAKGLQWLDQARPKVSVATSAVVALFFSMGLTLAHAPHSLTLTWSDPNTMARGFATFLVTAFIQLGGQHVAYESLVKYLLPVKSNILPDFGPTMDHVTGK